MDERSLLCEACGYDLSGLAEEAACPECARPVRRSLPTSRPGSPWQVRAGFGSWLATNASVLRRPRAAMGELRLDMTGATRLAILNCLVAAAVLVAPWTGTLAGDPARAARGQGDLLYAWTLCWVFLAQTLAIATGLLGLTACEYLGIRFIAARRRWRLTRPGAWQVCCHATIGWCFAAIGPAMGMALVWFLRDVMQFPLGGLIDLRAWSPGLGFTSVGNLLTLLLPPGFFVAGLTAYEFLVHLGVRANRYAARV